MNRFADHLDLVLRWIGNIFAWTMPLLMLAIVTHVILRKGFNHGSIKLEELHWHLYGMGMMVGLSYAVVSDSHIRVDVLQHRFSKRTKAVIDIAGTLFLFFPFVVFLLWQSIPFVHRSFIIHERSNSPSGLPMRWIIKAFIPLGCVMLLLAGLSHLLRCWNSLRK